MCVEEVVDVCVQSQNVYDQFFLSLSPICMTQNHDFTVRHSVFVVEDDVKNPQNQILIKWICALVRVCVSVSGRSRIL